MTESIIIFKVNDIKNGNGYVNRLNTLLYNLTNINDGYYENFKSLVAASPNGQLIKFEEAGRYIVILEMKKDWEIPSMLFVDFKKDDTTAQKFVKSILLNETDKEIAEKYARDFILTYHKNKSNYDKNFNSVVLEIDETELN